MVYLDYELGQSTRIEENRLKTFPLIQRKRNAFGGGVGYFFSYSTLAFTFVYFYRKFKEYPAFHRIVGSGLLAIGMFEVASILSVANMGNITEYNFITNNLISNTKKYHLEHTIQSAKAEARHEMNAQKAENELGSV